MKKNLLVLISLLLVSCGISNTNTTINYEFDSDNMTAKVVSTPSFNGKELNIPSSIVFEGKEYKVTSISTDCFEENNYLESVVIPDSVTSIGWDAFRNCSNLKNVKLGNGCTTLSDHMFEGCTSLKNIEGLDVVENIYTGTFQNTGLESISFSNLKYVGTDAFFNNSLLKEVTLNGTLTSLGGSCFERCPSLEKLNVSSSLTTIGNFAFKDSFKLNSFDFTNISSIGKYAFEDTSITSVDSGKISLGEGAFYNCDELAGISFICEDIPYSCFYDCNKLEIINIDGIKTIGSKSFYGTNFSSFIVGSSVEEISSQAFESSALSSLIFEDNSSLKIISRRAFYNTNLSGELTLPSSIKSIYNEAFGLTKLTKVNISTNTNYDINSFSEEIEIVLY